MRRATLLCLALVIALISGAALAQKKGAPTAHAALMKKAGIIAKDVAKLRGLRIKRPIKRGVMSKKQIRARILKRLDQEYSAKDLAAEELTLKRFGLLPPGAAYKKMVVDLLTAQVAGFYDPKERRLYIAGWDIDQPSTGQSSHGQSSSGRKGGMGAMLGDVTMAHEIGHALQDQHFDLTRFMKNTKDNGDSVAARQALVEGDGTAIMIEYMMVVMMKNPSLSPAKIWANDQIVKMMGSMPTGVRDKSLAKVPLFLRESLMFPYMGGLRFVASFRKRHSWKRIDRIYRKPPLSTEHILHPQKYVSYERPHRIKAGKLTTLAGYREIKSNVMGEMAMATFLRQLGVERAKAEEAAAGWGGDAMVVYQKKDATGYRDAVGVLYTSWDSAADAIEFFESADLAAAKLSGGKRAKAKDVVRYERAGHDVEIERKGDKVVMVIGAPQAIAGPLRAQIWKRFRSRR